MSKCTFSQLDLIFKLIKQSKIPLSFYQPKKKCMGTLATLFYKSNLIQKKC